MTEEIDLSESDEIEHWEPKFFGAMLADILSIKEILDPVFPVELDIWQTYFRHYRNPAKEIRWWLFFAEEYRERSKGKPPEECRQLFQKMLRDK